MSYNNMLKKFQGAFELPVGTKEITDKKEAMFRLMLIREEFKEVEEALNDGESREHILKELCDLVYVAIGAAVSFGMDFDKAFSLVHESNMSKLDDNGNPIYRDDGKVIKSKNYKEPNLERCI